MPVGHQCAYETAHQPINEEFTDDQRQKIDPARCGRLQHKEKQHLKQDKKEEPHQQPQRDRSPGKIVDEYVFRFEQRQSRFGGFSGEMRGRKCHQTRNKARCEKYVNRHRGTRSERHLPIRQPSEEGIQYRIADS